MELFWRWYDWNERTFWNSLTKKLASFLLLFFIDVAYLGIYIAHSSAVGDALKQGGANADALRAVESLLDRGLWLMVVLTLIGLTWNILQIAYIRHLILKPVREITRIFDEIARGEGDFSRDLPTITHDELRTLAESYNRFADKMRQIIGEVRKMSVGISREATVVRTTVTDTTRRARRQGEIAESVFGASSNATAAIHEVSGSAGAISTATDSNLNTARTALGEMNDIVREVESVSSRLARFNDTVTDLGRRSDSIRTIATLIRDVADQTNLLALNAAIEAARAGEQGRGFAVVADEVRKLAERVNQATLEIGENIAGMTALVGNTQAENAEINEEIRKTRAVVERSAAGFQHMVADFENTSGELSRIAAAMDRLSATNEDVHLAVTQLHGLSGEVSASMDASDQSTGTLAAATESVQELVSRFKIGRGAFDFNVEQARAFRDAVETQLTVMGRGGIDIWDQNYRPVPGTDPQKYEVGYLRSFEQQVQPLLEDALARLQGGVFTLLIDARGYGPIHNLKCSKPLTGDYATDLAGNRTKRLWTDPTGQRAAKNTQPLLLQTYARDTGEILSEINLPIRVDGRIWGNVRVGLDSKVLLTS